VAQLERDVLIDLRHPGTSCSWSLSAR
jgi:hypothetical protein